MLQTMKVFILLLHSIYAILYDTFQNRGEWPLRTYGSGRSMTNRTQMFQTGLRFGSPMGFVLLRNSKCINHLRIGPQITTEYRITLANEVRGLPKKLTPEQSNDLIAKREKLQEAIDEFNTSAKLYLPGSVSLRSSAKPELEDLDDSNADIDSDDLSSSDLESGTQQQRSTESASSPSTLDVDTSVPPEQQQILLPSSFGSSACMGILAPFARLQLLLCKGQANDILQALRLLIGKQSFHYRKKIRKGAINSNYTIRTRSHKEAQDNAKAINLLARIYRSIRRSMVTIGATDDDKAKYQVLKKEHLQSSTAVVDFNAAGQRNKSLSWIWHTHKSSTEDPSWLRERTSHIFCFRHAP